jgi:methyl-accepting chemotaxis protein
MTSVREVYKVVQDIRVKVVKIEEHMNNQNKIVEKNCRKIEELDDKVDENTWWEKIKSIVIWVLFGACGFLIKLAWR